MATFDEARKTGRETIPYDIYFGEMDLSEAEIKKRVAFAEDFEEGMLYIFALIAVMRQNQYMNREFLFAQMRGRYEQIAGKYMGLDTYMMEHIRTFAEEAIDTTLRRMDEDDYFTSQDRAVLISQNETNTSLNYAQYAQAIKDGKTRKRWVSERDKKVRKTHQAADGQEQEIGNAFFVGDSLMMFPRDVETFGASGEETVNCRCTVKYY